MTLLYVPAGEFTMGGGCNPSAAPAAGAGAIEKPAGHIVYLDAFWIDQTEVTNAQFKKFVDATGYQTYADRYFIFDPNQGTSSGGGESTNWQHPQGPSSNLNELDNHPVVQVSWNDAQAYCQWAGGNLPTDAQWEKAARGNDKRTYPWGNQAVAGNLLNFADRSLDIWRDSDKNVDDGYQFASPVGHYPDGASPYGALDMAGNVWEWAKDLYHEKYDDNAPASGSDRIMRGGSWSSNATQAKASCIAWNNPDRAGGVIGFRCAR